VQVFLPQALGMHAGDRVQRFGEHSGLLIGQRRQAFDRLPGIGQAFGAVDKLKQQPAALAFLQTVGQQQRRGQALFGQQAHAVELTLKMPRRLAAHQQLGQHRATAPDTGAHIALARQHAQQAEQLQLTRACGVRQFDGQRQAWAAPGLLQRG